MTIITFGEEDAKALSWVASGAENSDPGAVLIIDVDGTGSTARVSTNTAALIRSMVISVDDAQDESIALRAKTLASIASKVEEGVNLTLTTNGDKVSVACGATSLNLTNLMIMSWMSLVDFTVTEWQPSPLRSSSSPWSTPVQHPAKKRSSLISRMTWSLSEHAMTVSILKNCILLLSMTLTPHYESSVVTSR